MDLAGFDEECAERLDALEGALLQIAEDSSRKDAVDEAFRQLHTIKGNAGLFGFEEVVAFTHRVEHVMDQGRNGREFGPPQIDLFFSCLDTLRSLLDVAVGRPADRGALLRQTELVERLEEELRAGGGEPEDSVGTGIFLFGDDVEGDAVDGLDGVVRVVAGEPIDGGDAPAAAVDLSAATSPTAAGTARETKRSLRVPSQSLDRLMDLVGALVTAGARTRLVAGRAGSGDLDEAVDIQERLLEGVREAAMGLRMVEIGETLRPYRRMVRDVAQQLDKRIRLELRGEETEIDKSVGDKVRDPLTHLVRNALDHGIETPEERHAAGKPPEATVVIAAYQEFGAVVIEVRDDGRGFDREKILAKAKARGLAPESMSADHPDVPYFVVHAGFSMKSEVSDLSGRGVGLDVVATSVRELRGTLVIDSERGRGSTFRIRLPLTLAIINGFLIRVGDGTYVIPMEQVVECISAPSAVEGTGATGLVDRRGDVVPFIRMRPFFEVGGSARRSDLVLVRHGERTVGLLVDELLGAQQTVVKPMGPVFRHVDTFSGATILGSGEVALILDTEAIVRHSLHEGAAA